MNKLTVSQDWLHSHLTAATDGPSLNRWQAGLSKKGSSLLQTKS
jgi:hypothetical protein